MTREADRDRVGTVLDDKWTLERLLGVGGMGAVYAAKHRNGAKAAVKIFSPLHPTAQLRERFLREGYAANRVEHAGAVKVLDDDVIEKGEDEGLAYLVMELLEGESLLERAQREQLSERDLLEVADGVLAVLEAAHANGVVHRDLKPDNLFLVKKPDTDKNEIKVLDFGLARLLEKQEQSWNGVAFGTPTYMSPEQAAGKVSDIDGRTDIYALGSIMFQLSSNQRIHDAAHTLGLVVRMATTPAPKLQTVAPEITDTFATIVDRALAFDRDLRYQTATDMRKDVHAALAAPSEPGHLNLVSTDMRAPDSARVLPASTERREAESPAFAMRKTMPAEIETTREVDASPSRGDEHEEGPPSIGARLSARESQRQLVATPMATRAEPAVARAKERSGETSIATKAERSRIFSPGVLVFAAAALLGFIAFQYRNSLFGSDPGPVTSASTEPVSVPPSPSTSASAEPLAITELDDVDAGEDDEDEDEAGVPDASRAAPPRPVVRPAAKKPAPRKPGAPRKTKKRRWHW